MNCKVVIWDSKQQKDISQDELNHIIDTEDLFAEEERIFFYMKILYHQVESLQNASQEDGQEMSSLKNS